MARFRSFYGQELREDYFEVQQDFDGTTAVEVSLAATGFVSYYQVGYRTLHLNHLFATY
jgi:hypothetical protein